MHIWCPGLYPSGIGRWDKLRTSVMKAAEEHEWESKKATAFFRGSRTSEERDALVLLSRRAPALVDARYTKNQAWKSDADTLGSPPAPEVAFEDHCAYRSVATFSSIPSTARGGSRSKF